MPTPDLTPEELARFARQIGPGVLSREGQVRLRQATVLVSRVGGVGGPAAIGLVLAGVGRVILAHGGELVSPDLNRQVLGAEEALGQPRVGYFADSLRAMSRFVTIEAIDREPDDCEALELARRSDLIVSAAPTFEERLRLNAAAVRAGVPLVDAAQWGMTATLVAVDPGRTACLRCLYPEDPPFEASFPVVGAISAAAGSLAALEAIKILAGAGRPMFGRMRILDAFRDQWSHVDLARDPRCPCCGCVQKP
jgi:molybdopterin/thiamine biosynthesis adenylyltransferase